MKGKGWKKLCGLLLALCICLAPVFAGLADEVAAEEPTPAPVQEEGGNENEKEDPPAPEEDEQTPEPPAEETEAPQPTAEESAPPTEEQTEQPGDEATPEPEASQQPGEETPQPTGEPGDPSAEPNASVSPEPSTDTEVTPTPTEPGEDDGDVVDVYIVRTDMKIKDILAGIEATPGTVERIFVEKSGSIRGKAKLEYPVDNAGTLAGGNYGKEVVNRAGGKITGGTYRGSVRNAGDIIGGSFKGAVENEAEGKIDADISGSAPTFEGTVKNLGEIRGGVFAEGAVVDNGNEGDSLPQATATTPPTPTPSTGNGTPKPTIKPTVKPSGSPGNSSQESGRTISGGVFQKGARLNNYGTVAGGSAADIKFQAGSKLHNHAVINRATVGGKIVAYDKSTATNCKFGKKAEADVRSGGSITVYFSYGTKRYYVEYGTNVIATLGQPTSGRKWFSYLTGGDSSNRTQVKKKTTFGLRERTYVQAVPVKATATPYSGSGSGGGSGSSTTPRPTATPTPKPTVKADLEGDEPSDGEVEEEDLDYGIEDELSENFLMDGDNVSLDIIQDESGEGADYELLPIPAIPPEDYDDAYSAEDFGEEETEETEETLAAEVPDTGLVPGEIDAEGVMPGLFFVRAKGVGAQERRLSLTLSQIQRVQYEQELDVLLFRNGAATISFDVSQLFEGNIAKLMELMQAWQQNGVDFADYDLDEIDFDSIEMEPTFTEEELREFRLELVIAPATPVGYELYAELWLDDDFVEIDSLLENVGVTLHTEPVTQEVAVFCLDENEERIRLDTHTGRVPGLEDVVEGYEVAYLDGESSVSSLECGLEDTEYEGYCAIMPSAGTYYIGVLPNA